MSGKKNKEQKQNKRKNIYTFLQTFNRQKRFLKKQIYEISLKLLKMKLKYNCTFAKLLYETILTNNLTL